MKIQYTEFPSRNAVTKGVTKLGTLAEAFPPHVVCKDKSRAPCVGDYVLDPANNHRRNKNVVTKTALILDVDKEVESLEEYARLETELETAVDTLKAIGLEFLLYSSHSHGRPKDRATPYFGFRLCLPFAVPMTKEEHPNLVKDYAALACAVVDRYALPGNLMPLSQPWFVPVVRPGDDQAIYFYSPGKPLDRTAFKVRKAVARTDAPLPEYPPPTSKGLSLRRRIELYLLNNPTGPNAKALEIVLSARLPTVEDKIKSRHEDIVLKATWAVTRCSAEEDTFEQLLEIFEPWIEVMDDGLPRSGGWRGEVKRALEGAQAKIEDYRRDRDADTERELNNLVKLWSSRK